MAGGTYSNPNATNEGFVELPRAEPQAQVTTDRFAVIVLAAGDLSCGSVLYRGRALVVHATITALASGAGEVIVVAGKDHEKIRRSLRHLKVRVVQNPHPERGISSSIRTAVQSFRTRPSATVISLCDQPMVTAAHLRALVEPTLAPDGCRVVASEYGGLLGAPCAFSEEAFADLLELKGTTGARNLIRTASDSVNAILFENANLEVPVSRRYLPLANLYRSYRLQRDLAVSKDPRGPPPSLLSVLAI